MIEAAHGPQGVRGDAAMLDALRRAAGADAVETPAPGSWSVHGATPRAIVSPSDAAAIAAVLALCTAEGWTVEPAGAGTWLDHGRAPAGPADLILSTRRLHSRLRSEPADLVVATDAGVRFDALQQRLAADGQELTLDPPHHADATIGAAVALAAAGPLRASGGTPRDHVLGVDVVTGDGRTLRFGGRVVKNVAGYDGCRLLTGSRGTLGVITGLWLRVRARPAADRSFTLAGELSALLQFIAGLDDIRPAATELLGPATAAALGLPRRWTVALRLRGGRAELDGSADRISGLAAGLEVTEVATAVWDGLARLETAARPLVRLTGLKSELPTATDRVLRFISASDTTLDGWHIAAHAAGGIVRLWPAAGAASGAEPATDVLGRSLVDLRQEAEAAGGTMVLECASASLQTVVPARSAGDAITQRLEAGLKRVLDPAGILAPGRWP